MEARMNLDILLDREKELFDAYISNGKETDMLPILEEYSIKDNAYYTIDNALKYILLYVSSSNISEEELNRYTELQKQDPNLIFKRGKKAIKALIDSNGDEKELYILASLFAKHDGRVNPYPITYVKNALKYYIRNTKNRDLVDTYYLILDLTNNGENLDFNVNLVTNLIKFNDTKKAVAFIKSINISDYNLKSLINSYIVLYPANKEEIIYLKELLSVLANNKDDSLVPEKNKKITLKKLSGLLEDFLISDYDDISYILNENHMSKHEFDTAMMDAISIDNPILLSLIDKYNAKMTAIKSYKDALIANLVKSILHGVNYGNGFHNFNIFDYFVLSGGMKYDEIVSSIESLYNINEREKCLEVLENLDLESKYKTPSELKSKVGLFSKKGRKITDDEKNRVVDFILDNHWPLNNSLYFATCERYFDNDISLESGYKLS